MTRSEESIIQKNHNDDRARCVTTVSNLLLGAPVRFIRRLFFFSLTLREAEQLPDVHRSYLTSCFLGSKMLSSLSAYTFFDAVKRMICGGGKITVCNYNRTPMEPVHECRRAKLTS